MDKKNYIPPIVKTIEFRVEEGFQSSGFHSVIDQEMQRIRFENAQSSTEASHFGGTANWSNDWN